MAGRVLRLLRFLLIRKILIIGFFEDIANCVKNRVNVFGRFSMHMLPGSLEFLLLVRL